jgi:hypothetical protein
MFVNVTPPSQTITVQIGASQQSSQAFLLTLDEAARLRDKLNEQLAAAGR